VPDLDGAVTVVTDADGARGAASARAIAAAGARAVVLCGRDGAALGELARDLQASGCRAALFLGDPTTDDAASELVELVHELFLAREQAETSGRPKEGDR
jgi:NAD(P)-dependent dehydrogenase (short-subunit alcohol dehydrogenase family)